MASSRFQATCGRASTKGRKTNTGSPYAVTSVNQRDLAERRSRAHRGDGLAVHLDGQLATLDHEEHETALAFERDLLAGREAPLVELLREAREIPLVEVGEEPDVTQKGWARLRHGAIHTRTTCPMSRSWILWRELLDPQLGALQALDARGVELLAAPKQADRLVHRHVATLEPRHDLLEFPLQ